MENLLFLCVNSDMMILYEQCPICGQTNIHKVLGAEDYTVSHEVFDIWECTNCTLRFTQGVPEPDKIGAYYQSETYISHSDTRQGFVNKAYHAVRLRTLQSKKNLVQKQTGRSTGKMLDVGSGTGAFVNVMKRAGWDTMGLEPDQAARVRAAELYGVTLEETGKLFELPSDSFDAITLWHVLEHVHDLHGYMKRLGNLLKPEGRLFIAVPNYTSYDGGYYGAHWAAYDVPRHLYHFSPRAMRVLLSLHGLKLEVIRPMWYDSFYVSMLSEQYRNKKSNLSGAMVRGAMSNLRAFGDRESCSSVIYIIGLEKK